jgi:hypothetical protein
MQETAVVLPSLSDFSSMLGKKFRAGRSGSGEFDVELTEVQGRQSDPTQENFTLLFRAPGEVPPEQGIYDMRAENGEVMSIFLVPVSRDDAGLYFEAVFNTFVTKANAEQL